MAKSVDEDLGQLERDIRQLKIEYEQYFGGGKARPPSDIEWRIETLLKRYSDRGAEMNLWTALPLRQSDSDVLEISRHVPQTNEAKRKKAPCNATLARRLEKLRHERAQKRGSRKNRITEQFPFAVSWGDPDSGKEKSRATFYGVWKRQGKSGR